MQTSTKHETNTFRAMRNIFVNNGPRGLYKGVAPVLIGTPPVLATCLWSYYIGQVLVRDVTGGPGRRRSPTSGNVELVDTLSLSQIALAGAFSAIPTAAILGPAEQIKIRLQVKTGKGTATEIIRQIVREGGVRSLFRGTGLTLLRDVPGSFFYFATYEAVKRGLSSDIGVELNAGTILLAGGLAGMANWTVAIPFDTVKSRYQSGGAPVSLATCFRQTLAEGGLPALFRGLGPTLIRAFPASAAFFLGVEGSKYALNRIL
ncbi:hypothetical protein, variant [Spizellomyces punctatus DAOM BR117]|nr:hypothetical protein, variant [Spizellomyces punctatus DAOM BR117]KNC99457.1 hypothetical protein, variant [Spizellomyces punctatus DAOM BR117]|eukprot:XP_016607497.1 hypothetical protein, variant [Spizellomyces punctatus DAOM BR117]